MMSAINMRAREILVSEKSMTLGCVSCVQGTKLHAGAARSARELLGHCAQLPKKVIKDKKTNFSECLYQSPYFFHKLHYYSSDK